MDAPSRNESLAFSMLNSEFTLNESAYPNEASLDVIYRGIDTHYDPL